MVYGPRDEQEIETIVNILRASYKWARGDIPPIRKSHLAERVIARPSIEGRLQAVSIVLLSAHIARAGCSRTSRMGHGAVACP